MSFPSPQNPQAQPGTVTQDTEAASVPAQYSPVRRAPLAPGVGTPTDQPTDQPTDLAQVSDLDDEPAWQPSQPEDAATGALPSRQPSPTPPTVPERPASSPFSRLPSARPGSVPPAAGSVPAPASTPAAPSGSLFSRMSTADRPPAPLAPGPSVVEPAAPSLSTPPQPSATLAPPAAPQTTPEAGPAPPTYQPPTSRPVPVYQPPTAGQPAPTPELAQPAAYQPPTVAQPTPLTPEPAPTAPAAPQPPTSEPAPAASQTYRPPTADQPAPVAPAYQPPTASQPAPAPAQTAPPAPAVYQPPTAPSEPAPAHRLPTADLPAAAPAGSYQPPTAWYAPEPADDAPFQTAGVDLEQDVPAPIPARHIVDPGPFDPTAPQAATQPTTADPFAGPFHPFGQTPPDPRSAALLPGQPLAEQRWTPGAGTYGASAGPQVEPSGVQAAAQPGSKSFVTTWLLSWFLGLLGVDRFYLGKIGTGAAKLLTVGGLGVWALYDLFLTLLGHQTAKDGSPLTGHAEHSRLAWIVTGGVWLVAIAVYVAVVVLAVVELPTL